MRFGVIVCPRCKSPKGVDLSYKTTKCIRCGKNLQLNKVKILFKTNSIEEVQIKIGNINADKCNRF